MRKYDDVMRSVYQTIRNKVELKQKPEAIAVDIVNQYPTFVRFYDVSNDMQLEFIKAIAEQCWFDKYGDFNYIIKKS